VPSRLQGPGEVACTGVGRAHTGPCAHTAVSVSSPRDLTLALTLPQSPSRPDPPAKERPPKSAGDGRVQMPKGDEGLLLRPPGPRLWRVHMLSGASAMRGEKLC